MDELSASVERIGGVGLTIHEELLAHVLLLTLFELSFPFWRIGIRVKFAASLLCSYLSCVQRFSLVKYFYENQTALLKSSFVGVQEKIIDDLGTEMEGTSNRLDFVQVSIAII